MNVLITGGSRGIGAAAVRAFSARGDRVAFFYEKEDEKAPAVAAVTGAVSYTHPSLPTTTHAAN